MEIDLLSLFPEAFFGPLDLSIVGRARKAGLLTVRCHNIRDFGEGRHKRVDERPYGGGPGMVMTPGPVHEAVQQVRWDNSHVVCLSPQGRPLTAQVARRLAQEEHLVLVCGHYEGIDERVLSGMEEISIGDVVLSNGLLPAMVLIDAAARFIPGVLGHEEGADQESFEAPLFDHPHYAGPKSFEGREVPQVLLSGHHERIARWRKRRALEKTRSVRPELFWEGVGTGPQMILGVANLEASRHFFKETGLDWEKKEDALIIEGSVILLEGEFGAGMVRLTLPKRRFEQVKKKVTPLAMREHLLVIEDPDSHEWCVVQERADEPQTTN